MEPTRVLITALMNEEYMMEDFMGKPVTMKIDGEMRVVGEIELTTPGPVPIQPFEDVNVTDLPQGFFMNLLIRDPDAIRIIKDEKGARGVSVGSFEIVRCEE